MDAVAALHLLLSFKCLIWLLLPLECSLSWGFGAVVIVASDKQFAVHVGSQIVWWDMSNAFHIASFFRGRGCSHIWSSITVKEVQEGVRCWRGENFVVFFELLVGDVMCFQVLHTA